LLIAAVMQAKLFIPFTRIYWEKLDLKFTGELNDDIDVLSYALAMEKQRNF